MLLLCLVRNRMLVQRWVRLLCLYLLLRLLPQWLLSLLFREETRWCRCCRCCSACYCWCSGCGCCWCDRLVLMFIPLMLMLLLFVFLHMRRLLMFMLLLFMFLFFSMEVDNSRTKTMGSNHWRVSKRRTGCAESVRCFLRVILSRTSMHDESAPSHKKVMKTQGGL